MDDLKFSFNIPSKYVWAMVCYLFHFFFFLSCPQTIPQLLPRSLKDTNSFQVSPKVSDVISCLLKSVQRECHQLYK